MEETTLEFLKKQGWIVEDWTGATDTQILNWIEENVTHISSYGTQDEVYITIQWEAVFIEDERETVHTFVTKGKTLRECVANAFRGSDTLEEHL